MNNLRKLITVNLTKPWKLNFFISKRLLYSPTRLGINAFLEEKEKMMKNYQNKDISTYKKRIKESIETEKDIMIFTNDILKLVYLANDKEDVNLIHKLLKKLKLQRLLKVESFNYGPIVMRLHHIMNLPMEAKSLIENPIFYADFESSNSFIVFLDILFKNKLFEEVIQMFNHRLTKSHFSYNGNLNNFYFAACYKLNTKESFDKAFRLWQDLQNIGFKPGLRMRLFFSALSINQNEYFCAMETLPTNIFDNLSENFKIIIYAKTKRLKDAIDKLKMYENDEYGIGAVLKETISIVENEISNSNEENRVEFNSVKDNLINKKKIIDLTIDEILCHDINYRLKPRELSKVEHQ